MEQDRPAKLFQWFSENQTINLIAKDKSSEIHAAEAEPITKSSYCEKLLGIKIDLKLV